MWPAAYFTPAYWTTAYWPHGRKRPVGGGRTEWRGLFRPRSEDEIRREREAWGIIPKEVKEVITNVAEQQVEKNWTQKHANTELRRELRLQGLIAQESQKEREYAMLLRAEIERILDEEDAIAVITLTFN